MTAPVSPLQQRLAAALANRFVIERELAAGGMGLVFLGHDLALRRPVAVKVLRPELATAVAAERFVREARVLAQLSHPRIVPVHEAGERDGLFYYVMDCLPGETLAARLERGPMPAAEVRVMAHDLLDALAAAHAQGIIHRDVKPPNIFLHAGRATLADWGIARILTESDGGLTDPGRQRGSPAYMAPEQMAGQDISPRTDLYALGLICFQALTGRRWTTAAHPRTANLTGVPPAWRAVFRALLEPDPAGRPGSAAAAAALLPGSGWRLGRRLLLAAALVAAVGGTVFTAGLYQGLQRHFREWFEAGSLPKDPRVLYFLLRGEHAYRAGHMADAAGFFEEAEARDPSCLLCSYRIHDLDSWLDRPHDSTRTARLAGDSRLLRPGYRELVRASLLPMPARLDAFAAVTRRHEEMPEAWYFRGEEAFHRGPLFGGARADAAGFFEQAVRLDSLFAPAWQHLVWVYTAEGDSAAAARALRRLESFGSSGDPESQEQASAVELGFAWRFSVNAEALTDAVLANPAVQHAPHLGAGPRILPSFSAPQGAVRLGTRFQSMPVVRRSGAIGVTLGLLAMGRPDSAMRQLAWLEAGESNLSDALIRLRLVVLLEAVHAPSVPGRSDSTRAALERLILPQAAPLPLQRQAAWLLAVQGDARGAAFLARDTSRAAAVLARLAAVIAEGRQSAAGALAHSESLEADSAVFLGAEPGARALLRLSRAEWQAAVGNRPAALATLRWYEHLDLRGYPTEDLQPADVDWALGPLALWRRARYLEAEHGPITATCHAYGEIVRLWQDGEPTWRLRADSARVRVIALGCGGTP